MRNPTGKGGFKAGWKNQPTTNSVRVPEVFKDSVIKVARLLDEGIINPEQLDEWLEENDRIQHLLRQAIVQPDPPRHLRGL